MTSLLPLVLSLFLSGASAPPSDLGFDTQHYDDSNAIVRTDDADTPQQCTTLCPGTGE